MRIVRRIVTLLVIVTLTGLALQNYRSDNGLALDNRVIIIRENLSNIRITDAFEDAFHPGPHIITDPSEKLDNLTLDNTQPDDIVSDLGQKPTDTKPPDKKDKSIKVVMAGYMRGGTTFLGELFQRNPQAQYWYEPLGGFYTYYYAVKTHAAHGIGLTGGDVRILEEKEKEMLAEFLDTLLSCDVDKLPVGTVTHPFWDHHEDTKMFLKCVLQKARIPKSTYYTKCMDDFTLTRCSSEHINSSIAANCPHLVNEAHAQSHNTHQSAVSQDVLAPFMKRETCLMNLEAAQTHCSPEFKDTCKSKKIRAGKVHRFSLQAAQALITRIPEVKFIYYIRDPRGIEMSRHQFGFPFKHVNAICQQMRLDNSIYEELSTKYPDSFLRVRYEDLAEDSFGVSKQIYSFLGSDVPQHVINFLKQATQGGSDNGTFGTHRKNSKSTAHAWRTRVTKTAYDAMTSYCRDILIKLNYDAT